MSKPSNNVFSISSPSYVSSTSSNSVFVAHTTSTFKTTTEPSGFVTMNQSYVTGASYHHEFKKRDARINGKINAEMDGNANNVFKPVAPPAQTNQEPFAALVVNAIGGLGCPPKAPVSHAAFTVILCIQLL